MAILLACAAAALWAASGPADTFRFTILGDRTGTAVPEVYERVWSEISLLHPDFVINVGDSIQGGDDARAASEWAALRAVWDRHRNPPLYLVAGNHDIWSQASEAAFTAASGRPPFYSFDYGQAHFTVLDNSRTETLSDAQMKFLESDLAANAARRPKFVFFHRCFWIPLLKLESGDFPLHRAARRYGVDYVVSGHGHQFLRMARDGITYTEVGSSGASLEGSFARGEGFPQGRFYHHVWVTVTGPSARFTVKEIGEPYGKGRMFDAGDWGVNGPRPPA